MPQDLEPSQLRRTNPSHYCECTARREPMLHLIVLDTIERARSYARLLMPLSNDGQQVTMLMAVDSKEQNTRALRDFFQKCTGK